MKRIFNIFLLLTACVLGLQAQEMNKLYLQDINVIKGKTVTLPVYMENTSNKIVAIQFDLGVPTYTNITTSKTVLDENRCVDHVARTEWSPVSFSESANFYRVMVHTPSNTPVKANAGRVLSLELPIPDYLEDGEYPLYLKNVILSDSLGNNLTSDFYGATLKVLPTPDFEVSNISISSSTVMPGDEVSVSWTVTNVGNQASSGGWKERLYFVSRTGEDTFIGEYNCDNSSLAPEASESRNVTVAIPELLGIEGNVNLRVELIPNSDAGESYGYRDNNTMSTEGYGITVGKKLYLTLPEGGIEEGYKGQISCRIARSGNWNNDLTVTLAKTGDDRLVVPETVMIPHGSSSVNFYISVVDNDIVDAESTFTISASATGYEVVSGQVEIQNDDLEGLTVTAEKTELNEGEKMMVTVSVPSAPASDLTLNISSDQPSRLKYPSTVTIPAGNISANFEVEAIENSEVTNTLTVALKVSATGMLDGECLFFLNDNDMPELELQLMPQAVSEGAGANAVVGKLIRKTKTENKVTIVLSDDSEGQLYYSSKRIVMNPGVTQADFTIGVTDNANVDGNRDYNVTAAVYISACDCSAGSSTTGSVSQTLTVTDDDGPTLKVMASSASFKEGEDNVITISHNTSTDQAVTLTLSSDYDEGLEYDHSVTIPAGQNTVDVTIHVKSNEVANDSKTITFTVAADGYTQGSCWAQITDQTLPDATVSVAISKEEFEAGETATVSVTVKNIGRNELPSQTRVNLYLGDSSSLFACFYTQEALAAGGEVTLSKNLEMPQKTGDFSMQAIVNENLKIAETVYSNNASDLVAVKLKPSFVANASVDKSIYGKGETVRISGTATGSKAANTDVEVYVINDGLRQTISATTDASGNFAAEYTPYEGQAGRFTVGACYPGEGLTTESATFDIHAVNVMSRSAITEKIAVNETTTKTFIIKNPGVLPLTGLTVEATGLDSDCSVSFEAPTSLQGGEETSVKVMMTGMSASEGNAYKKFDAHITTAEGAEASYTVYYYSLPQSGRIVASEKSINTTMIKSQSRDYPVTITNTGRGETGKITVSLPEAAKWLSLASPREMASMQSGDSATVILRFTPTEDQQINVPVTAQIAINCANGEGMALPMTVEPVSTAKGTMVIDVCDENTYYAAGGPHLAGAQVTVKHPTTGALIKEGVTDANGLFSVELPEGYYAVTVTAEKHDQYNNNILVSPGRETKTTVNLSIQGITITWNVEETEIEDQYEIVTTVTYETNVPVPVVDLSIPSRIPADSLRLGESLMFNAILTNKGLITAHDAELELPEGFANLKFEALNSGPFTIAPHEMVVVPVKVTRIGGSPVGTRGTREGHIDNDPCVGTLGTLYYWDCGNDHKWHRYGKPLHLGVCGHESSPGSGGGGGGGGGGYGGGGGGYGLWGSFGSYTTSTGGGKASRTPVQDCVPCQNKFALKLLDCALQLWPPYKALRDLIDCAKGLWDLGAEWNNSSNAQRLGRVLSAAVSCSGLGGGGGDDLADATADLHNALTNTYADMLKGDDGLDFSAASNAGNLAAIAEAGAAFWAALKGKVGKKGWGCFVGLLEPCDLEGTPEHAGTRTSSTVYPDYIRAFQQYVYYGFAAQLAFRQIHLQIFNDPSWLESDDEQIKTFMDAVEACQDENGIIPETSISQLLVSKPENVSESAIRTFIERLNNTVNGTEGNAIDFNAVKEGFDLVQIVDRKIAEAGYSSIDQGYEAEYNKVLDAMEDTGNSVCASITLQFKQEMVLTRQAFRGTLTVFNGHEDTPMRDIKLRLSVTDEEGNVATSHEFQINPESLDGFTGELNFDNGWELQAQGTGTATILFIPTKYAAETTPKVYGFGGALTYTDPFTGLEVTRELYPVKLTVKPSPELDLTYFMQRNILGDDALTLDIIEPIVPAEFSLIIKNKGYGDATNVKMTTHQPEIIDNEKGLLIDFELLSSQLNGGDKTLALGESVATDFGTIPAGSTSYAQWWFTSTLLGHFTSYKTEATHLTSYGNPDLSLLDKVEVHELIHTLMLSESGTPLKGFLVNDVVDANDTPDMLYLTDGTTANVSSATAILKDQGNNQFKLEATASAEGWNYGSVVDPSGGRKKLIAVTRQSDGTSIPLDNFWLTDRTLRDGKEPLYEHRIHFADQMAATGEVYNLTFEDKPITPLDITQFSGITVTDGIVTSPVKEVTVTFNKDVAASTFATDDITLTCAGKKLDVGGVTITEISKQQFKLNLGTLTAETGYYVLTVQANSITDAEGYTGEHGRETSWTQFWETTDFKVTAKDYTITYGDNLPTFEYSVEGGELAGTPQLTCEATAESPVGTYPIITSKGTIESENVTYVNGTLTIQEKVVGLSWSNTILDCDGTEKTPTATATGLVGDDACVVSVSGGAIDVGTYTATASSLSNANYQLPADGLTCNYEIVRNLNSLFNGSNLWAGYVAHEDLALPSGLTSYIITTLGSTTATALALDYIPKGEPILLKRENTSTSVFRASAGAGVSPTNNLLEAYSTDKTLSNREGFVLYKDQFVLVNDGTLPAGHIFLPDSYSSATNNNAATRSIVIDGEEATSLQSFEAQNMDSDWFDIFGRKLGDKPSRKGVYILNGHKVVVK